MRMHAPFLMVPNDVSVFTGSDNRLLDQLSPGDQADLRRLLLHRLMVLGAALERVAQLAHIAAHAPAPCATIREVQASRASLDSRLLHERVAETLNRALLT